MRKENAGRASYGCRNVRRMSLFVVCRLSLEIFADAQRLAVVAVEQATIQPLSAWYNLIKQPPPPRKKKKGMSVAMLYHRAVVVFANFLIAIYYEYRLRHNLLINSKHPPLPLPTQHNHTHTPPPRPQPRFGAVFHKISDACASSCPLHSGFTMPRKSVCAATITTSTLPCTTT